MRTCAGHRELEKIGVVDSPVGVPGSNGVCGSTDIGGSTGWSPALDLSPVFAGVVGTTEDGKSECI